MNELHKHLTEILASNVTAEGLLIDVGAYQGDFTKPLLEANLFSSAILFEPNANSLSVLKEVFAKEARVTLEDACISDTASASVNFYCSDVLATGSVLPYRTDQEFQFTKNIKKMAVPQTTLDSYLENTAATIPVTLIKIDTQGNDLRVLRGAKKTLEKYKPVLVVEMIFVALYEQQAFPLDIGKWLDEMGYQFAGLFNEHYTASKCLAFSDAIFIPKEWTKAVHTPFQARPETSTLIEENKMLYQVCEERLALINRIHTESVNPSIIITEYPKSGGTWLVNLLGDALAIPKRDLYITEERIADPNNKFYKNILNHHWYKDFSSVKIEAPCVVKSHELPNSPLITFNGKYIHLVRDGRDVLVSKYFYEKKFCVDNGLTQAFDIPFDDYLERVAKEWSHYVESWLAQGTPFFRYEDLLLDPKSTISNLLSQVNRPCSAETIDFAIADNTIEKSRSKLSPVYEHNTFVRKGISGDWRNHFTKKQEKRFHQIAGVTLIKLGYLRPSKIVLARRKLKRIKDFVMAL